MNKTKTKSAAKKRFKKVSGGTKVKRAKAFRRHLLTKKSTKTKRNLRRGAYISPSDLKTVLKLITA